MEPLKAELETFDRNKQRLLGEAEGKFVVVHGDTVAGSWDTYEDALRAGYEEFGLAPFLVKQVEVVEQVHSVIRLG